MVLPACIYGPSPYVDRSLAPTSFNSNILGGINGTFKRYLGMQMNWVSSTTWPRSAWPPSSAGARGGRYLVAGALDDNKSLPEFCAIAAEMAGSTYRVETFDPNAPGAE
ncbi:MAG: hypothetical protein JO303_06360 [Caulobacteraceae bacterium]|nr:hypothetical protein [Caulobacteraceae bacterium]